jgi:SnoaL-like protein
MTDVMTKDATAIVEAYFAMWNEEDVAKRAQHIKDAWADSGHYTDPARDAKGHDALNDMVTEARPHFPGHTINRTSGIDAHHDQLRFSWSVVGPDGSVPVAGVDFGILAPDGRLERITGFFGELAQETTA